MRLCTLLGDATAIVSAPVLEFDFGGESEIHKATLPFLPHTYTLHSCTLSMTSKTDLMYIMYVPRILNSRRKDPGP
jgi:hypothetical protein